MMGAVTCAAVGRTCEYAELEHTSEVKQEMRRVVDRTIGTDDIAHHEPTGRSYKTITKGKRCKFCGGTIDEESRAVYGTMQFVESPKW